MGVRVFVTGSIAVMVAVIVSLRSTNPLFDLSDGASLEVAGQRGEGVIQGDLGDDEHVHRVVAPPSSVASSPWATIDSYGGVRLSTAFEECDVQSVTAELQNKSRFGFGVRIGIVACEVIRKVPVAGVTGGLVVVCRFVGEDSLLKCGETYELLANDDERVGGLPVEGLMQGEVRFMLVQSWLGRYSLRCIGKQW